MLYVAYGITLGNTLSNNSYDNRNEKVNNIISITSVYILKKTQEVGENFR